MDTKQFNDVLAVVPGSFKSKLERIRRYLHLGKASVMVGAGFSCNADVPSYIQVKQWADVGKDIYCRLNNLKEVDESNLVFKTPMRLASQFEASFGRSELDNLIKDSIPDDRMMPGALHRQLLSLPWRDVFTTNYDTLLERAREGLLRTYSVVTSKEMLLYKKSPRIIKLHGSFPDKTPFLMTEEDFRTYPTEHAEFVNTVRQALVESIFCLIGFSGDDPNFTSWQGWLRDVMGDYAGPSYLITWDKKYDESFKTLMEHRGIEVLNLSEISALDEYKKALDFFFTYLSEREPEWEGAVSYDVRHVKAEELIKQLRDIRLAYPGWFILPKHYYGAFDDMEYHFPYLETTFKEIEQKYKEPLLFELDWRADISLSFKDFEWYRKCVEEVIAEYSEKPMRQETITLGISLLRLYRHHPENYSNAKILQERLSRELPRMTASQASRFYYTIAGNALSIMDYDTVVLVLSKWNPFPSDYEGIIYKTLVLAESGELSDVTELLNDTLERITQSLTQNITPAEQSLRCVIENLLAFYSGERMPENDIRFSFLQIRDFVLQQVNKPPQVPFEIKHGFGIGSEKRNWNTSTGTIKEFFHPYRYLLLCEAYGFPYGLATKSVDEKLLAQILPSITGFGMAYSLGPMIRSGSRIVTESYSSRYTFNYLTNKQADKLAVMLLDTCSLKACEKAKEHRVREVLSPFLSRLSSMCSSEVVVKIFNLSLQNYRNAFMPKRDDINIIYSNVMPEAMQEVYTEVFSSSIFKDRRGGDLPLPNTGYDFYTPGDNEVRIAIEGIFSNDKQTCESAYERIVKLLSAKLDEAKRNGLENAIRRWRKTEPESYYTRHSFQIVQPSNDERERVKKQVKDDLSVLLKTNYKYLNSSVVVASLFNGLQNLVLQAESMTNKQISLTLDKLAGILEENIGAFSVDDSKEMMGGLRRFTLKVFRLLADFVRLITRGNYSDRNAARKLFKVLEKYIPTHLPVRVTMERLNNICQELGPNKMRDIITEDLFSDNEEAVIDSCNGLIAFAHNSQSIQTVLQRITFYCSHNNRDIRLYLQTLALIPEERMSERTQEHLAIMMRSILESVPKQDMPEEYKIDIMHDGVRLAASFKHMPVDSAIGKAVKEWEAYATNDQIYNDVRRPWYLS